MKFVDEIDIKVSSGHGGDGCVSFRREKFIPKGGPDGGDGGRGGNVIFRVSPEKRTLHHLRGGGSIFKAKNGSRGRGSKMAGKSGEDLVINVPVGTIVIDPNDKRVLKDLNKIGDFFIAARGGIGGRGNVRFKSSTNRSPRFAQSGEPGRELSLKLELKLLADVGIIGLPNSGKSTLLRAISSAKPKVGNYPFTTITPHLGNVLINGLDSFTVADIPGLICGAHKGVGLGSRFLRHIERTRVLVHLIDSSQINLNDPLADVDIVNREILLYSDKLALKPRIFVLNKLDLPLEDNVVRSAKKKLLSRGCCFLCISAINRVGITELIFKLSKMLDDSVGYGAN